MDNSDFSSGSFFNNFSKLFTPVVNRNRSMDKDRVYTDVISSGLVSRIVKYQTRDLPVSSGRPKRGWTNVALFDSGFASIEPNSCLSNSFHSLPTSLVNMDKPTVTHVNTLSRILKCEPKINLNDLERESSCENRPILHPVSVENEIAPTPSVLDVLKEISRKRINNTDSGVQKPCKKCCIRVSDSEHNDCSLQDSNNGTALSDGHQLPLLNDNLTRANKSSTNFMYRQKPKQKSDRKRQYNYNDDIRSSLSSSKRYNIHKRYKNSNNNISKQNSEFSENLLQDSNIFGITNRNKDTSIHKGYSFGTNDDKFKEIIPNNLTKISSSSPEPAAQKPDKSQTDKSIEKVFANTENDIAYNSENHAKPSLTLFNKICLGGCGTKKVQVQSRTGNEKNIQFVKPRSLISTGPRISTNDNLRKAKLNIILNSLQGKQIIPETIHQTAGAASIQLGQQKVESTNDQTEAIVAETNKHIENPLPLCTNNTFDLSKNNNPEEVDKSLPTLLGNENIKNADTIENKTMPFANLICTDDGDNKNEANTAGGFSLQKLKPKVPTTQIDENSNVVIKSIMSLPTIKNSGEHFSSFLHKSSVMNSSTNVKPVFEFGFNESSAYAKNNGTAQKGANTFSTLLATDKTKIDPLQANINDITPINNNYSSVNLNNFSMQPNAVNSAIANIVGSFPKNDITKSSATPTASNDQLKLGNGNASGGFKFCFKGVSSGQISEQSMNNINYTTKGDMPTFNFTGNQPSAPLSTPSKHKLFSSPMAPSDSAGNNVSPNLSGFKFDKSNVARSFKSVSSSDTSFAAPLTTLNTNLFGTSPVNPLLSCGDRPIRKATRRLQK